MATHNLNACGLRCPQPVLKVAALAPTLNQGDILEVQADCPSFPKDIQAWCEKIGKTLLLCDTDANGKHSAQVQL